MYSKKGSAKEKSADPQPSKKKDLSMVKGNNK